MPIVKLHHICTLLYGLHIYPAAVASTETRYRIAIIGGGIGGTFTSKYLADYDVNHRNDKRTNCLVDEIVVFDVSPTPGEYNSNASSDPRPPHWQGSRISSLTLQDGSVVELGASILYNGNQLVVDMMNDDPDYLIRGNPMGLSNKASENDATKSVHGASIKQPSGFGIYHGNQEWLLKPVSFISYPSLLQPILKPLYFLWRYNFDYFRLQRAVKQAIHAFDVIYALLNNTEREVTYFANPMDMWDAIGLKSLTRVSFHEFLDELGLSRDRRLELPHNGDNKGRSWWDWRSWLPGMGCLRSELVTAMTINTYNQDLNEMNGLVGLISYVPMGGNIFSIEGGNYKLLNSPIQQAQRLYDNSDCKSTSLPPRVRRQQKKITTVISNEKSMELLSGDESIGVFDIVILAAPLQMCRVKFLIHSPMGLDPSILHEMPLTGVHDNIDVEDLGTSTQSATGAANNEHGHRSFADPLLPSATTPYTSVVTTIISNVTLNSTHFGLSDEEQWPQSILVSERGKVIEGLTTVTILSTEKGLVKTFSTVALDEHTLNKLFGPYHVVDYVQIWGGDKRDEFSRYGGATPSFFGGNNSESLPYLLYDGAAHYGKTSAGPALYYVNAIESSVSAIEISAIGAKSVAKLISRRLGLISPLKDPRSHEEL